MNLQAEKLEVLKMILETDDKTLISEIKSLFKKQVQSVADEDELKKFYDGFRDGVQDVKLSLEGKIQLKDAKTWLNEF